VDFLGKNLGFIGKSLKRNRSEDSGMVDDGNNEKSWNIVGKNDG
jgi:hypothetical protein